MGTTACGVNVLVGEEEKFRFCLNKLDVPIGDPNRNIELAVVERKVESVNAVCIKAQVFTTGVSVQIEDRTE